MTADSSARRLMFSTQLDLAENGLVLDLLEALLV